MSPLRLPMYPFAAALCSTELALGQFVFNSISEEIGFDVWKVFFHHPNF